jgi:hypothetical protein
LGIVQKRYRNGEGYEEVHDNMDRRINIKYRNALIGYVAAIARF